MLVSSPNIFNPKKKKRHVLNMQTLVNNLATNRDIVKKLFQLRAHSTHNSGQERSLTDSKSILHSLDDNLVGRVSHVYL